MKVTKVSAQDEDLLFRNWLYMQMASVNSGGGPD